MKIERQNQKYLTNIKQQVLPLNFNYFIKSRRLPMTTIELYVMLNKNQL